MKNENQSKRSDEEIASSTLMEDSYFAIAGKNYILGNKHELGDAVVRAAESGLSRILASQEAIETRQMIETQERVQRAQSGYHGNYSGANNEQVEFAMYNSVERSLENVSLGKLEEICKAKGVKLEKEIPKEVKDLSVTKIIESAQKIKAFDERGALDISKLSEVERCALELHKGLTEAYKIAGAEKIREGLQPYAGINNYLKSVYEKYNPKSQE